MFMMTMNHCVVNYILITIRMNVIKLALISEGYLMKELMKNLDIVIILVLIRCRV